MPDIDRLNIRLRIKSVGDNFFLIELRHNILKCWFIKTKDYKSVKRNFAGKLNERAFDVFKITVTIEVIRFERCQNGYGRRNRKKRAIEFIRFDNNKIAMTKSRVCSSKSAQFSAYND